ncbi:MAG TPA: cytochrome C [Rudaea sp.]|nr:cytochrome C [Rudaea sp.]
MRKLVLLLLGLAVGIVGTANVLNALHRRDAYPRGLMDVMQHHFAALRDDLRANRCGPASLEHLKVLRALDGEIGGAVYGEDTPDAPFREYEQRLRDALTSAPAECTGLAPAADKIGAACEDCHRQYR